MTNQQQQQQQQQLPIIIQGFIIQWTTEYDPTPYTLIKLALVCRQWAATLVPNNFISIKSGNFNLIKRLSTKPIIRGYPDSRPCTFYNIQITRGASRSSFIVTSPPTHSPSSAIPSPPPQTTQQLLPRVPSGIEANTMGQLSNGNMLQYVRQSSCIQSFSLINYNLEIERNIGGEISDVIALNKSNLTKLELVNVDLASNGSSQIIKALLLNHHLTELNLSRNFMREKDAIAIGQVIKSSSLIKVNLSFNEFRLSGVRAIIEALSNNKTIREINLEAVCHMDCPVTPKMSSSQNSPVTISTNLFLNINSMAPTTLSSSFSASSVGTSPSLSPMLLGSSFDPFTSRRAPASNSSPTSSSSISMDSGLTEAIYNLKTNTCLTSINLSHNTFSKQVSVALSELAQSCQSITNLQLNNLKLDDDCGLKLGCAIRDTRSLSRLSLNHNHLGRESVTELSFNMCLNVSITELYLSNNMFGDDAGLDLGNMLAANRTLEVLDLSDNNIGSIGTKSIMDGLQINTSLRRLVFNNNKAGDLGGEHMATMLSKNKTLRVLEVCTNNLRSKAGKHLANSLATNNSLTSIRLSYNLMLEHSGIVNEDIKDCIQAISLCVQKNKTLMCLEVDGNHFQTAAVQEIQSCMERNLTTLVRGDKMPVVQPQQGRTWKVGRRRLDISSLGLL
ncbi:hypothetical protein SAMD00019534_082850 [Acytostelium subglobosum LB1]|uniref:hypothetical protein n=1 Tax=Acytostelium subglobosum LB1 TaxID=1410327 RepID=UPI000644E312|nr:hypothetical protein SAMD00019534_082850 [Acytostelium subglobosum LB1]GAM25110.1 hypothetical protein SAMD00019534_082850 [Acytostelium subglobosum LB1]|eukprot:XP_012752199.1 hypothetical protein SAMD00019534_082850 [Acytostelium subglobosum LB1]